MDKEIFSEPEVPDGLKKEFSNIEKTLQRYESDHLNGRIYDMQVAFNFASSQKMCSVLFAGISFLTAAFYSLTSDPSNPDNPLFLAMFSTISAVSGIAAIGSQVWSNYTREKAYEEGHRPYTIEEFTALKELIKIEDALIDAKLIDKNFFNSRNKVLKFENRSAKAKGMVLEL